MAELFLALSAAAYVAAIISHVYAQYRILR